MRKETEWRRGEARILLFGSYATYFPDSYLLVESPSQFLSTPGAVGPGVDHFVAKITQHNRNPQPPFSVRGRPLGCEQPAP